jgi:SAM-dependent methyltransferase
LPVTGEVNLIKHEVMLPATLVAGKRILDIGSFIGQTGDWCLNNGAKSYTGVEIHPEFHTIADELMTKYHLGEAWQLINMGVDDYFSMPVEKFDLIFCGGVIFAHVNHIWFLKELAKRSDHVILESRHPKAMWKPYADLISDVMWEQLEYNIAYQEWHDGAMTNLGGIDISVRTSAGNSSIAAVKLLMELEGFDADLNMYHQLKAKLPDAYGFFRDLGRVGRYAVEFKRSDSVKKHVLSDAIVNDVTAWNQNIIDWKKV